jgi:hypothetical protein
LHAAEREQLSRERCRTVRGFFDLIGVASNRIIGLQAIEHQVAVALDDCEQVVEIMRDATSQASDSFHFL